ncbi:ornithine cyclodeaminase [Pararobbsia silviterrae]|uniref:Ornithine cyclodeaminase n=1 Tax=Pararobbsia silviterrae TaxID=1792498 RepID=A0A494XQ52_9BURK|nr:ornithine cyclodeaminase [Pararobbsia silviterrae]RKP50224.1 ornithine cyclodeaminase [Pararobbsia silviterrae]
MTRYLDVRDLFRLIDAIGVPRMLQDIASEIEADFLRWAAFDKTARVAAHSREGVIELMPVADAERFGFKFVNGHPNNTRVGLPTVMAFGALADVATGYPLLLSEFTLATALRTAATSAIAARRLARPGARTMALVGNGAQAEFQALAFHTMLGIDEIRAFDIDPATTDKLERNLAAWPALRIVRADSVASAMRGADIVTTATADKRLATIVDLAWVEPGMHLNAIGGDCPGKTELDPRILERAHVVVEYAPQSRIEGEIQQMPAAFGVTELAEILDGSKAGRLGADDVTVFDSVGFALEDYSTLRYLHASALRLGIGTDIGLVAQAPDPKNLFGYVLDNRHARADGVNASHAVAVKRARSVQATQ